MSAAPELTDEQIFAVFSKSRRVRSLVRSITREVVARLVPRTATTLYRHRALRTKVLRAVGDHFRVSRLQLTSDDRQQAIARPRAVCYWILRRCGLSYPEVGKAMLRHHTTILAMVRMVEADADLLETARELSERMHKTNGE